MSSLAPHALCLTPIVILIRPQMGENIGAVARAMSNFGLKELRLVAPRDGWPNLKALEMAAGAEAIIQAAAVYPDFAGAMADAQLAYATTARPRDMEKRVLEPAAAMQEIKEMLSSPSPPEGEGGVGGLATDSKPERVASPLPNPPSQGGRGLKIALVFGPERSGLANEDITLCDTLITIPTAPENSSLNLAQSMVILGYEWLRASGDPQAVRRELSEIAPHEEWQGLFGQLESYLDASEYFRVPHKKPVMWQNLENMLLRARFSSQEVRTFRGMLRSLWERSG